MSLELIEVSGALLCWLRKMRAKQYRRPESGPVEHLGLQRRHPCEYTILEVGRH